MLLLCQAEPSSGEREHEAPELNTQRVAGRPSMLLAWTVTKARSPEAPVNAKRQTKLTLPSSLHVGLGGVARKEAPCTGGWPHRGSRRSYLPGVGHIPPAHSKGLIPAPGCQHKNL